MRPTDFKLSTRLTLGFATMAAMTAMLGAIALMQVDAIRTAMALALNDRYPKVKNFLAIRDGNAAVARAVRDLFIFKSRPRSMPAWRRSMRSASEPTNCSRCSRAQ